jgi:hypothetical protein
MIDQPEQEAARAPLRPDRGWTWQEEPAMALADGDYEIRIKGRLSDSRLAAFEGLTTTVQPVETVLHGPVQDQAALHGLLDRIQSLGLELVEIRQLSASAHEAPAEPSTNRQIRRLVLYVQAVRLCAVYAARIKGRSQPDRQSPIWCWLVDCHRD